MRRRSGLLVCLSLVLSSPPVEAAPTPPPRPTRVAGVVLQGLQSPDPDVVLRALGDLRVAGPLAAAAVPAIADRLQAGTSPVVAAAAIETLGDIAAETASDVLAEYAQHRIADIRARALVSLTRTRGKVAVAVLRRALSDPDTKVRALAAAGLGRLPAQDAVDDLFLALARQTPEAAESIGLLCAPAGCERLLAQLGHLPLTGLDRAMEAMLFRADVTDDFKIKIIWSLRELGTAEAHRLLEDVRKRWPKGQTRSLASLDQAIQATAGAPGTPSVKGRP